MAAEGIVGSVLVGLVVAIFTAAISYRVGEKRGVKKQNKQMREFEQLMYGNQKSELQAFGGLIDVVEAHDQQLEEIRSELQSVNERIEKLKRKYHQRNNNES